MSIEPETMRRELEQALVALSDSVGPDLARRIRPVLFANLDRGRIHVSTEGDPDRLPGYVLSVAQRFTTLHEYLHAIQLEQSTEHWTPLYARMQTWAYNYLLRKGFAVSLETQEIAAECATEAAVNLLTAYFPYDTDFDPWAHIIVQHACRKRIGQAFKKSAVPADKVVELEDTLADTGEVPLEIRVLREESAAQLNDVLGQLSEARRAVIVCIFFEELTAEETAAKLGKTVGAVYSLQFNALQDLRKIFSTIRDSLNE